MSPNRQYFLKNLKELYEEEKRIERQELVIKRPCGHGGSMNRIERVLGQLLKALLRGRPRKNQRIVAVPFNFGHAIICEGCEGEE